MHLKRSLAPKSWPIPRKGTKYIIVPSHNKRKGIPILVILRDMLKIARNRKEVKKILNGKKAKVNGKLVRDEKFPLVLFDILEIAGKSYKLILENKKFRLEETKDKEKIVKIIGKKILSGKKMQINLNDGRNYIVKENYKVNDSLVINFEGKIVKKRELKDGAKVVIISGKHIGEEGKIERIDENKIALIKLKETNKINLSLDRIMAM